MLALRRSWLCIILIIAISCLYSSSVFAKIDCDEPIYISSENNRNGTFVSKNYPDDYPNDYRHIFCFQGGPNERVEVRFLEFDVKGIPPRCVHDYVDIFTNVKSLEKDDLLDVHLHGRYCGGDPDKRPHLLVSMRNIFIISFNTDSKQTLRGFRGEYKFISATQYMVGTPSNDDLCGQIINSQNVRQGILLSPTYPGMYPDNIACYYKLLGQPGERIKITFNDFDLYHGGDHCPIDSLTIWDDANDANDRLIIDTYCGKIKDLRSRPTDVFSTGHNMHMQFRTGSGRAEPTKKSYVPHWDLEEKSKELIQKGFNISFEFSSTFVKLDFISQDGTHIRGTECDQRIRSKKESRGVIISPGYPNNYPRKKVCRYFIDGLVDKDTLEKVALTFETFKIPVSTPHSCNDSYVKAYNRGQSDANKMDYDVIMCDAMRPGPITSFNPRMLLVFNSSDPKTGQGFKAQYKFIVDYAIPGTPASLTDTHLCHFKYYSSTAKEGFFNSPRHPSSYPPNMNCTFEFIGEPGQQIRIIFVQFNLTESHDCANDSFEFFTITEDRATGEWREKKISKECSQVTPGPLVTDGHIYLAKARFISGTKEHGQSTPPGFRAKYQFRERSDKNGSSCFSNLTKSAKGGDGIVKSDGFPHHPYKKDQLCEWLLYASQPDRRIIVYLEKYHIEKLDVILPNGTVRESCKNAVLKIYTNTEGVPYQQLCGKNTDKKMMIISEGNFMRLRFITSDAANGKDGFLLHWTELISPPPGDEPCADFQCQKSDYCVPKERMCNIAPNCGENDDSDEDPANCAAFRKNPLEVVLAGGVGAAVLLLVAIITCACCCRRKRSQKQVKQKIEVRYVTRGSTPNRTGGTPTSNGQQKMHIVERTEMISIV